MKRKRRKPYSCESVVKINVHRMLIRLHETYPEIFEERPDLICHLRNAEKLYAENANVTHEKKRKMHFHDCCIPVVV